MGARQYVGDAHLQAGAAQLLELQQQVVRLLVSRILHRFKVKRVKDSRATPAMPLTAHQEGGDFSLLVEIFCARSAQQNCAAQRRQAAPQAPPGGAQRRRRRQAQTRRLSPPLSPLFCTTFHFTRS